MWFCFTDVILIISLLNSNFLFAFAQNFAFSVAGSVTAGSPVTITWSPSVDPTQLTFALLFKQGDRSTGGYVVDVIANSGIPNTGSYTWNVPSTVPSGAGYYLRLQTGLASDWQGGVQINGLGPTAADVYGLSNPFVVVSSVPSSSISNPTFSVAPLPSSSTSSDTSSTPSTTSPTSSTTSSSSTVPPPTASPKPRNRAGVIAGSVVGGLVALGLLAGLAGLAAHLANQKPPTAGASPGHGHEFIFLPPIPLKLDSAAEKLDATQLTLTLTPLHPSKDCTYQKIAWQVFNLDSNKDTFIATLPSDLGFGTVTQEHGRDAIAQVATVRSPIFDFAPPGWTLFMKHSGDGLFFEKPRTTIFKSKKHVYVKNESNVKSLAIGSYHANESDEDESGFQPFLVVEGVKNGREFSSQRSLILQVYHTRDIQVGQLLTDAILKQSDSLLGPDGKEVAKLPQKSTWQVVATGPGKIKLEVKS